MSIDLASLLDLPEGETIDFKASSYDLSDIRKKRDFAKDLASLANTPREGDAHIVLGVKKRRDGSFKIFGIEKEIDDAELQSVASSLLEPTPRFVYYAIPHGDVVLGLITIPAQLESPVAPKKTEDPGFVKGTVYSQIHHLKKRKTSLEPSAKLAMMVSAQNKTITNEVQLLWRKEHCLSSMPKIGVPQV